MTNIEKNVMRRVHTIYRLRPICSGSTVACVLSTVALWGIGSEVWVARVFENAPHGLTSTPQFYLSAFTNTDVLVQALTLLVLVSAVYLARATAKLISDAFVPVRA